MNRRILAITAIGLLLMYGAGLGAPASPVAGIMATFAALPLLLCALLEERVTTRSLLLGLMLTVVISIGIGLAASAFPGEDRGSTSRLGFAVAIAVAGIAAARIRRGAWATELPDVSSWHLRRSDFIVVGLGVVVLSVALAIAITTPSKRDPYVALSATNMDGSSLPAVIEGKAGSAGTVLVGVRNATAGDLSSRVIVSGADSATPIDFTLAVGDERRLPVAFHFGHGATTLRVELHSDTSGLDRFIVIRLLGT